MTLGESIVFAAAGAAVVFEAFAYFLRGPEDTFVIANLRVINKAVSRCIHRHRLCGMNGETVEEPLPLDGPAIVVANHRSGADPNLVAASTRRWIHFLMAAEYYEMPVLRWVFRALGCIPVRRDGNDLAATRRALSRLRNGGVIGIFPQGGIQEDDALDVAKAGVAKAGVALLASRSGAPVVPLYIAGSPIDDSAIRAFLFRPSRSRVYCGAAIRFPPSDEKPTRDALDRFTQDVLSEIAELRAKSRSEQPNDSTSEHGGEAPDFDATGDGPPDESPDEHPTSNAADAGLVRPTER